MNDSLEEYFQLLSSMSPKVDKSNTKKKKKVTTILALKKSLRRSSIYDKLPQTKPNQIHIESASSSSINDSSSNNTKSSKPDIIIPASDESSNEFEDAVQSQHLSTTKFDSIKRWVLDVEPEPLPDCNESLFSQLSIIDGDCTKNLLPVANSTFINGIKPVGFNELFKDDKKIVGKTNELKKIVVKKEVSDSFRNEIKKKLEDEVYIIEDSSDDELKNRRIISENKMKKDDNKFKENVFNTSKQNIIEDEESYTKLLDEVYGKGWRKYKENVLPASEPRPKKNKAQFKKPDSPKTEIKPKRKPTKKNPPEPDQKKSLNLLQTLHKARVQQVLESPWKSKLTSICDSDSESDDGNNDLRGKLKFDESPYFDRKKYRSRQTSSSSKSSGESSSWENVNDNKVVGTKVSVSSSNSGKNSSDEFIINDTPLEDRLKKKLPGGDKKRALNDRKTLDKPTKTKPITKNDNHSSSSSSSHLEIQYKPPKIQSKSNNKQLSFLASLSPNIPITQADPAARIFRNGYKTYRHDLLIRLFKLYNEEIFDNCISDDTPLEWSDRLTGTAAYCACKKITHRNGVLERKVRFVLSTKVLDSADRLRDTLVHEMCHGATWIVNKISDGHGKYWKAWAAKAMRIFPELPPIKRCHDYAINTKYTYKCTKCGYSIGRHTKSLNIERKCCGYCHGTFEVLINKQSKAGETKSMPATPKKEPTGFALFVKENYANYKDPTIKHGDVMKILGQKFQEMKVKSN